MTITATAKTASLTPSDRPPAAVPEPTRKPFSGPALTRLRSRPESPCFPRPERPDGAPRTAPERILDPSIRLREEDLPQARRWLVEIIARRAVQIVKDEKGKA